MRSQSTSPLLSTILLVNKLPSPARYCLRAGEGQGVRSVLLVFASRRGGRGVRRYAATFVILPLSAADALARASAALCAISSTLLTCKRAAPSV